MKNFEEFRFKIVVIGDGAVGKTSLIKKFTKGTFEKDYIKTLGAQFSKFNKKINGDLIRLVFWDIAGQDDFNFLHPLFFGFLVADHVYSGRVAEYKSFIRKYQIPIIIKAKRCCRRRFSGKCILRD